MEMTQTHHATADSIVQWRELAREHERAGHYQKAYQLLQQCSAALETTPNQAYPLSALKSDLWRLSPLWWANLQHGGLKFRRCTAQDADFYERCFNDKVFSRQFNRQRPWHGDLAAALKKSGTLPPLQTGLLQWVVEFGTKGPIALASLSSLDPKNLRTELSIGFPGEVPSTLGIKATLMMLHFALVMMPFNKVYAYVYVDNPQALHNAVHLGFVHEGMLQDHFYIPGHGFVSVNAIGMTRVKLHGNTHLKTLAKRKIGQNW